MSKKKVQASKIGRAKGSQLRAIVLFSAAVFLIKVIWLSSQQGRGLLGADGELSKCFEWIIGGWPILRARLTLLLASRLSNIDVATS
jgi:hypothetical protein